MAIASASQMELAVDVVEDGHAEKGGPAGAKENRPVADQINWSQVTGWLSNCDNYHGPSCSESHYSEAAIKKAGIFLVDVAEDCITKASLQERFVALSYVWGHIPTLCLLTSNLTELTQPGSLKKDGILKSIPTTIRDAMTVVKSLKQRYLWVDTLCIMQDHEEHKKLQIAQMASIYDASVVTIVACTATDADSSLPGVSTGTRLPRLFDTTGLDEEQASYADDASTFMLGSALARTPHHRRAWTFQEVILSKRCLFFFGSKLIFQCQKSRFEETASEEVSHGTHNQAGNWPQLNASFPPPQTRYAEMMHDFSRTFLTFPSDRLDAVTGLLTALELAWGWKFFFALPDQVFGWALLWVGEDPSARATLGERTLPPASHCLFPSWSWLSYPGPCYYLLEKQRSELVHHVDWASTTVWDGKRTRTIGSLRSSVNAVDDTDEHDEVASLYRDHPAGTMTIIGYMARLATLGRCAPNAAVDAFETKRREFLRGGEVYTALVNSEGNWYGTLRGISETHLRSLLAEDGAELALVLLSSTQNTWIMGGFGRPIPCFDSGAFREEEWCMRNVLLITNNERPYRRLAVGEVHKDAWEKMNPEPDLIWLA